MGQLYNCCCNSQDKNMNIDISNIPINNKKVVATNVFKDCLLEQFDHQPLNKVSVESTDREAIEKVRSSLVNSGRKLIE